MLQPKKSKYRKQFRGKRRGVAQRGTTVAFGEFGLKATTSGWVNSRQIEAARKKITFMTKRNGKYWTSKPVGVKMGSGKGAIDTHVAVVKPGMVLFELAGVSEAVAKEAFRKAAHKLSVQTTVIKK